MIWFLLHDAVHQTTGDVPNGAVIVPRPPEMYERWDGEAWVMDDRLRADTFAGAGHIEEARSLKYVEALAILNGLPMQGGMLALEAAAKGVDLLAYAQLVIDKRAGFVAAELLRQSRQARVETDVPAKATAGVPGSPPSASPPS